MIDDAFTFKVEVDLKLEMLSDQMDSKLIKVHVFKSDFIPYACSANKKHSSYSITFFLALKYQANQMHYVTI